MARKVTVKPKKSGKRPRKPKYYLITNSQTIGFGSLKDLNEVLAAGGKYLSDYVPCKRLKVNRVAQVTE